MDHGEFGRGLWFLKVSVGDPLPVRTLNRGRNEGHSQSCGNQTDGGVYLGSLLRDLRSEPCLLAHGYDEIRITWFGIPWKQDDLAADSLDLVEITMALEEEFEIEFGDEAMALTTMQQIVDYIQGKLEAQP
jgi:hypothetical protein